MTDNELAAFDRLADAIENLAQVVSETVPKAAQHWRYDILINDIRAAKELAGV